ncbi:MAG: hypothetical protein ACI9ZV_000112 [Candidatus Azotimanducaceae bacterium]|jgi:hypothetical protein
MGAMVEQTRPQSYGLGFAFGITFVMDVCVDLAQLEHNKRHCVKKYQAKMIYAKQTQSLMTLD